MTMLLDKPCVYIPDGRAQCFKDGERYYNTDFSAFGIAKFEVEDDVDAVVYWALDRGRQPQLRFTWVKHDPVWREVDEDGEAEFIEKIAPNRESKRATLSPKMKKEEKQKVVDDVADAVLDKVDEGKSRRYK
jgi:hypothetical protein